MKNYRSSGKTLTLPAPAGGVVSGMFYLIGAAIFAVANTTAAAGVLTAFDTEGEYASAPKATGTAWVVGDVLYWDDAAKNFTKTAGANRKVAVVVEAAAAADAVGVVKLIPTL